MARANYKKDIEQTGKILQEFRKSKKLFGQEKDILELLQLRYRMMWSQVHEVLWDEKTAKSEQEIQDIVKEIIRYDLPIAEVKIKSFERSVLVYQNKKDEANINLCYKYLQEWLALYEKLYALVCCRSLEHYALFLEWDKPEEGEMGKIWKYSIDPFGDGGYTGCTKGFWYYANQMVLNNKINFLMKQMPTSFGKSYSDSVLISFIFGIEPSTQILKVVGNKSLMPKCTKQVVNIMTHSATRKRFLMVFPKFLDGLDEETKMLAMTETKDTARMDSKQLEHYTKIQNKLMAHIFSTCVVADGLFTIRISGRDTSFECITKNLDRDGLACTWLFLDDVIQRSEIMKVDLHNKDIRAFDGTWKKRCRDEKKLRIVVGGTTYDPYDLLVVLKARYSKGKVKRSPINKYTTLSLDETAVFVSVPKLDENDQLTFPQKTVLASVLEDRKNDPELFMAMDMQQPIAPKDTPFYWNLIRQYAFVPDNASEYAYAVLDPARTGKNFVSMPICRVVKEQDKDGVEVERHYLVSCLYMMAPMDTLYDIICGLIEKFHIIKFHIEKNTDTSLKYLLDLKLKSRGINFCEISEVYATKVKEDRIYANETAIKNSIVFPAQEMYARSSEMGQFLEHIISYKYTGSDYDDSIDSISMYIDKFVNNRFQMGKAKLLYV